MAPLSIRRLPSKWLYQLLGGAADKLEAGTGDGATPRPSAQRQAHRIPPRSASAPSQAEPGPGRVWETGRVSVSVAQALMLLGSQCRSLRRPHSPAKPI